jgi:hypothetical protein
MAESPGPQPPTESARTPAREWIALAVVVALAAAVRWHRRDVPLERDEGEYAYAGSLLLQGEPPFAGAYNMKLPGIHVAYAAIMAVFGQTTAGIRLGLLVVNAASIVLVHRIVRRSFDGVAALAAAAVFATLSLHSSVTGLFANSEHFVLLPALGSVAVLCGGDGASRPLRQFVAGALAGVAFVVKQPGIAFVCVAVGLAVAPALRDRPVAVRAGLAAAARVLIGAVVPFAAICAWTAAGGTFGRFWFWTFTYAAEYGSQVPLSLAPRVLATQLATMGGALAGLWCLAGLGVTALFWSEGARRSRGLVALFALASAAAVCPGWLFRNHYFVLALPAAALLAGAGVAALARAVRDRAGSAAGAVTAAVLVAGACGAAVASEWDLLVRAPDEQVSRRIYGTNPFPESVAVARYIRAHSQPGQSVAVIGSEPQICFYAGRRSATGHVYTYALMEEQPYALQMQREMIREIEQSRPEFVVFVGVRTSWLRRPTSPAAIFAWADDYLARGYRQVGTVEIGDDATTYRWDDQVRDEVPRTADWLAVFRRRAP